MQNLGPSSDVLGHNLYFNGESFTMKFYSPDTKSYGEPKKGRLKCTNLIDKLLMEEAGLRLGRIWISSWEGKEHLEFGTTALKHRRNLNPENHGC